jgi:hypothetical protein
MKSFYTTSALAAFILTSALSLAGAYPAFAQTGKAIITEIRQSINPDMDEFIFTLESYEGEYGSYRTKTITIADAKTGELIQTLITSEFNNGSDAETNWGEAFGFVIEDMNFDGYDDIRIIAFNPAGPNTPYICWLWDKDKRQYVHHEGLSDIPSLEIDKDNEWISASMRSSAVSYRTEFYRWVDGNLTLFKAEDSEILDD